MRGRGGGREGGREGGSEGKRGREGGSEGKRGREGGSEGKRGKTYSRKYSSIQYESKKRFHYRAVPFQKTAITVRFVCRFWQRYRSVLPSELFRFVSFGSVSFCLSAFDCAMPAEIVERASD